MTAVGYDGGDYVVEIVRDFAGKGKRDIFRRVRYDVIERLWRSKRPLITLEQREAAVRLQVDDQLAATATLARSGGVRTGDIGYSMSVAVIDARGCVRAAQRLLAQDWPVTKLVVLDNLGLGAAEKCLEWRPGNALLRLRNGLDRLSDLYARA